MQSLTPPWHRDTTKNDILGVVGRVLISCILLSILVKEREYMSTPIFIVGLLIATLLCGMLLAGAIQKCWHPVH